MISPELTTRRDCLALFTALPFAPAIALAASRHDWKTVQAALDGFVRERNAPGAAVAISYGDSEPAYLSAGTIAFDSRSAFDADSICRVYSITKNVTRIASLLLVEDGKIELDQPVATVLPEFARLRVSVDPAKSLDSRPAEKVMTMRHLITQTSGLGNWTPGSDSGEPMHRAYRERGITPGNFASGLLRPEYGAQVTSMDEMVRRVAELPLVYEPGTVVHYSIGFDVMGLVIERVTGKPYGAFLEERLWGPLRMGSTGFQVAAKNAARLTTNYDATEGNRGSVCKAPDPRLPPKWCVQDDRTTSDRLKPPTLLAAGGSLLSTARDFLRYARMLLNDGTLEETRVMKVETARLATGNINPPGVAEPDEAIGAGTRALMRGAPIIPPGMVGAGGSTGTLFWIDKPRRGAVVFMVQVLYGSPARSPFQKRLFPAIESDLAAAGP
jgi:CubicO group peptidase (beta-lactamase class C family)